MYQPDDQKHADSVKQYPQLTLSDGEYVVTELKRHPIGIISIWFVDLLIVACILAVSVLIASHVDALSSSGVTVSPDLILVGMALLTILVLLIGFVGSSIYSGNRFYVTNEAVIQKIRSGLFDSREQMVSLGDAEDVSYAQVGILAYTLGYGSIRLRAVGDATTYRFTMVSNPRMQLDTLNAAVEDFKSREHGMDRPRSSPAPTNQASDQTS